MDDQYEICLTCLLSLHSAPMRVKCTGIAKDTPQIYKTANKLYGSTSSRGT
jgi:hypothetical protein